ncbi:MAG: hypothetical protein AAFN10_16980 [Bacteroidota bacterium]
MRLLIMIFAALLYSASLFAQGSTAIQLGYSGELGFHPGLQLGYEYTANSWPKSKKNGNKRQKSLVWQGSISQIWHPETRSFTFIEGGVYYRTLKPSGFTRQWSFRIGGSFIENAGTTYVEQEDGSAEGFQFAGYTYAALSLGYGWGYDFRAKRDLPLAVILQPQASFLFGYNQTVLPLLRVELGLRYYLNSNAKS